MKSGWMRFGILVLVAGLVVAYFQLGLSESLSLDNLKQHHERLVSNFRDNPWESVLLFFGVYVVSTAVSLPGATILTLAAGAIFGFWYGTLIVSLASTIGATFAFLGARFLFRDLIEKKFRSRFEKINEGIEKEGAAYLLTLRLLPIVPFFLVNILMGLTSIRTVLFFFVSQIGMLPGTLVYVNAGTQLSQIQSTKEILSPAVLLSLALLGILPMLSRRGLEFLKARRSYSRFKKPKTFDYNMVVIGAGSAGLVSAYIAAAVKAKVALVEKHRMGGDCLNTGCVPSKALIRSAKIFNFFRRAEDFGLERPEAKVDFAKVMERVQRVVTEIAPHDSVERYTGLGVECIRGEAKMISPYEVEVGGRVLRTKNIVIATGAGPLIPQIPGLSEVPFLTSDNVWGLRTLPERLVILGGGPIGCELAQCFARFGSRVTLVEMADRLMVREDSDVSQFVASALSRDGVTVRVSHKALRIERNGKDPVLVCEHGGAEVQIPFQQILLALGRKANTTGFGLEDLGIEISPRGTVVADEYLRTTNYPNIYACGDVTGPYQFTHTASHQAWYVAVNSLFSPFRKYKVDYRVIPWCTFTDPEVARVGLNELEARERGVPFQVTRYDLEDLDRAIAEGEAHGFVKVLTIPGTDRILGATIVGDHAGDIISEYVTAMKHGFGLNKILGTIHIYPTLAEANKYAAGVWKRQNAPEFALRLLEKYQNWRRR